MSLGGTLNVRQGTRTSARILPYRLKFSSDPKNTVILPEQPENSGNFEVNHNEFTG